MKGFSQWLKEGGAIIVGDFPKNKLKDFNIMGAVGKAAVDPKDNPPLHWVKKHGRRH